MAVLDEGLETGAGEMGEDGGEEAVEAVAGGGWIDSELRHGLRNQGYPGGMKGGNGAGANAKL